MVDRLSAALILAGSLILYWQTYTFRKAPFASSLGPAFFPRVVLVGLMALSLALLVWPSGREAVRAGHFHERLAAWRYPAIAFVTFGVYAWLLPVLGFAPSTFLYLAAVQYLLRPRPWRAMVRPVAGSLAAVVVLQLLFERVLQVILPHGRWM